MGTSLSGWAKKGMILTGNNLVKSKKLLDKNPKKLPNLLERSQLQSVPNNALMGEDCKSGGKIFIKPLSTNKAWKGRRFKTDEHNKYCEAVSFLLPKNIIVPEGLLKVEYEFGLSSRGSDFDNAIKSFTDILSKKYGFNDNRIMIAVIRKAIVEKGKEYIYFSIDKL